MNQTSSYPTPAGLLATVNGDGHTAGTSVSPADPDPILAELRTISATLKKLLTRPAVEAALVSAEEAAALTGVSEATWHRLKAAGKTPAPVRLGGKVLYHRASLDQWIQWGCPPRKEFEARMAAKKRS
jgi:excisionase family DNA binding protein